jgi:hypothetical protein
LLIGCLDRGDQAGALRGVRILPATQRPPCRFGQRSESPGHAVALAGDAGALGGNGVELA